MLYRDTDILLTETAYCVCIVKEDPPYTYYSLYAMGADLYATRYAYPGDFRIITADEFRALPLLPTMTSLGTK